MTAQPESQPVLARGLVRRVTRAALAVALAALAFLGVTAGSREEPIAPAVQTPSGPPPAAFVRYPAYEEIAGRDPRDPFAYGAGFRAPGAQAWPPRPEAPPAAAPAPVEAAPAPFDASGLQLLSAWPGGGERGGLAWVQDRGKLVTLGPGESLRGAEVVRVEPDLLVLARGAEEIELRPRSAIRPLTMKPFRTMDGASVRVVTRARGKGEPRAEAALLEGARPRGRRVLGISLQELTPLEASQITCPKESRLRVSGVQRSADDVREGDFVLAVEGERVRTVAQVLGRLLAAQERSGVAVRIWREGKEIELVLGWKE